MMLITKNHVFDKFKDWRVCAILRPAAILEPQLHVKTPQGSTVGTTQTLHI